MKNIFCFLFFTVFVGADPVGKYFNIKYIFCYQCLNYASSFLSGRTFQKNSNYKVLNVIRRMFKQRRNEYSGSISRKSTT